MNILIIIYLIIGGILGCGLIYAAMHDEEMFKEEEELSLLLRNNRAGKLIVGAVIFVITLFIALLWPFVLIYCLIKKGYK